MAERYGTRKIMKEFMASRLEANQSSTPNKKSTIKKIWWKPHSQEKKRVKPNYYLKNPIVLHLVHLKNHWSQSGKERQCHQGKQRKINCHRVRY